MNDLINKVKDLYEQLLVRSRKFNEDKSILASKSKKNDENEKVNDELLAELEVREKAVKKIEDVVKLKSEVAEAYKQYTSDKKVLAKDKAEHEEQKQKDFEENKAESEALSAKNIKLKKAELALDEEKKNYKDKVMKEINDNIEKQKVKL